MIKVYNTLSRKKEGFEPGRPNRVTIYVCGPTVYNFIHIGNARCYVAFDAIVRYLRYRGFDVFYARNLTDVDDKIINRASEENSTPAEIASQYTVAFENDMKLLGVGAPDVSPKATEHIDEMISMVEDLVGTGHAYDAGGDVFFDVASFDGYGKLSARSLDEMRAGERIEPSPKKRNPLDFALWKKVDGNELGWDSPWGRGRPGWHLECSVMSLKYLGMSFDIHGGGQDLIFPHHENEIAQSEAATGSESFVKYWLHNGFVNVDEEKMAKSVGNVVLVRDLFFDDQNEILTHIIAGALRILFLSTHYRSPIDFSTDKLEETLRAFESLEDTVRKIDEISSAVAVKAEETLAGLEELCSKARVDFEEAMDDDFNTATALARVFWLKNEIEAKLALVALPVSLPVARELRAARKTLIALADVLGIPLGRYGIGDFLDALPSESVDQLIDLLEEVSGEVLTGAERDRFRDGERNRLTSNLVRMRSDLRERKEWTLADKVRSKLDEAGLEIEDSAGGSRVRVSFTRIRDVFSKAARNRS